MIFLNNLKKNVFLTLSIIFFASLKSGSETKQLVLGVPTIKNEQLQDLRTSLFATNGVTYKGFCPAEKLLLLEFDRTKYNEKNVIDIVTQAINSSSIYPKNFDFEKAHQVCNYDKKMFN